MVQSTQARATSRTNADGWIEIRDELGRLWCKYHPERRVIQQYRAKVHRQENTEEIHEAEIAIDDLISGKYKVSLSRSTRHPR
jgi:hypothetical protein